MGDKGGKKDKAKSKQQQDAKPPATPRETRDQAMLPMLIGSKDADEGQPVSR